MVGSGDGITEGVCEGVDVGVRREDVVRLLPAGVGVRLDSRVVESSSLVVELEFGLARLVVELVELVVELVEATGGFDVTLK